MGRRSKILEANYTAVRKDVFALCRALNFNPTFQQKELLDLIQHRESRIACKSGQGPGKTTVSTIIGIFLLLQHEGAMGVLTAPTMRQCRDIWLAEARRVMRRADPWLRRLVKVLSTKIQIAGCRDWEIKTMTATNEEAAQGFHEENLFVIVEEASGVPRSLITQFKGTLSNPDSTFLMIGNPNTRDCNFFDCFNSQRHKWATCTFDAEETPASSWFDPQRNVELAEEFGKDSDVYRVRVKGQFPHADPRCIMSSDDLELVTNKKLMRKASLQSASKQFGIDLARFGGDESTIYRRSGQAIVQWTNMAHVEPADVLRIAMCWQTDAGWRNDRVWYVPDAGGMGQGAMHVLYETDPPKQVFEFHTGAVSAQPEKFANLMTEGWFSLAKRVRKKSCYLPNDPLLIQQLSSRQYNLNKKGQIIVESKDEYKKRGHDSPDRADGCIMSMLDVQYPEGCMVLGQTGATKVVGIRHK